MKYGSVPSKTISISKTLLKLKFSGGSTSEYVQNGITVTDFRAIDDKSLTDVACSNEEVRFVENEHNITGHNKIGGHIPDNRGDDNSMDLMKMTTVTPIKQQSQS